MTDYTAPIARARAIGANYDRIRDDMGEIASALSSVQDENHLLKIQLEALRIMWDKSGKNDIIARAEKAEAERDALATDHTDSEKALIDQVNALADERDALRAVIERAIQSARENAYDGEWFFPYDVTMRILSSVPAGEVKGSAKLLGNSAPAGDTQVFRPISPGFDTTAEAYKWLHENRSES